MTLTNIGIEKYRRQPQYLARAVDGGDGQFYPGTMTPDQRLRVDAAVTVTGIAVDLTYADHVTQLPGNPLDPAAEAAANPEFTFTRDAAGFSTKVETPEYAVGGDTLARRLITRDAAGFQTVRGKWVSIP